MGASLLALAKSIYYIHSVTHTTSGPPVYTPQIPQVKTI